jgi:hypothetical protein
MIRAEGVQVRTPSGLVHGSKTAIVREIVVNGPDGKPDWKRTAIAREKAAAQN